MSQTPNWGSLVAKGRAKAIGVPWTEEEALARSLGIPAEYVRSGILTVEDFETAQKDDAKAGRPLERLPHNELVALAKERGIEFTPETPDATLAQLLAVKPVKPVKKSKKK
jgi:hypothetical protein